MKKIADRFLTIGILLLAVLLLAGCQANFCSAQSSSVGGWLVEQNGGYCSESNGTFRLWENGDPNGLCIALYKPIQPQGDFTFSLQVKAATPESCCIFLKDSLPIAGSTDGLNFEYGHYGEGDFLLVCNSTDFMGESTWASHWVAYGDSDAYYTMRVSVSSSPFEVTTSAFDENGTLLGSSSTGQINNFTFADIHYIGFSVWGTSPGDYSFRNIEDPFDNSTSMSATSISISAETISTLAGSPVNVFGTLSDSTGVPLENETVVLSYTFEGIDNWIPISSATTDENGDYSIQWINSASGTFTFKTEFAGDSVYDGTSNLTSLSFLPYPSQQVFLIESNSTVTDLRFNNETGTLSFNVTGQSGTTGYLRVMIAKTMLPNSDGLQAYIDGNQLNYTVTSGPDCWVFLFNYHHSTHQITMHLAGTIAAQPLWSLGTELVLVVIILLLGSFLAVGTWLWVRHYNSLKNSVGKT